MTEHAIPVAAPVPTLRRRNRPLRLVVVAILLAALLLVAGQIAIAAIHPAGMGSIGAVNVADGESCTGTADTPSCVVSDYAPGKPAAMAFSIRNNGPITMTVESVQPLGVDLVPLIALYPALPARGDLVSWTDTRPFEEIEVGAGQEATVLMLGNMSDDCGAVGANWSPDSGLIFDHALLRVRWGLIGSDVNLPFVSAMEVRIPDGGACSGA